MSIDDSMTTFIQINFVQMDLNKIISNKKVTFYESKGDKTIKLALIVIGIIILVFGIIDEIDGIGRFSVILLGAGFCLVGSLLQTKS